MIDSSRFIPTDRISSAPRRRPWASRAILTMIYLSIAMVYGVYEWNAYSVLRRADTLDASGRYQTAAIAYSIVLEKYPLSITVAAAHAGGARVIGALREPALQNTPLSGVSSRGVGVLPPIGLPTASILLVLAAIIRFRQRPRLAIGLALFGALTAVLAVVALSTTDPAPRAVFDAQWIDTTARVFQKAPLLYYFVTYVALAVGCAGTLTSTRALPSAPTTVEGV